MQMNLEFGAYLCEKRKNRGLMIDAAIRSGFTNVYMCDLENCK